MSKDKVWRLIIEHNGKKYVFLTGGNIFDRLRKFCFEVSGWMHKQEGIPVFDAKKGTLVEVWDVATCEIPITKLFQILEDENYKVWRKKYRTYLSNSGDLLIVDRGRMFESVVLDISDFDEIRSRLPKGGRVKLKLERLDIKDILKYKAEPEVPIVKIAVGQVSSGASRRTFISVKEKEISPSELEEF